MQWLKKFLRTRTGRGLFPIAASVNDAVNPPGVRVCRARHTSDQMTCECGNVWDMNDPAPPLCPAGVTEASAPLTLDQRYWLDRRAAIIEALRAEGFEIWSDKDRVWLHRIRTTGVPASLAPSSKVLELVEKLDGYLNSPEQIALRDALLAALIPVGVSEPGQHTKPQGDADEP